MNNNTLLITVTLASALLWAGCNKSGKLNETSTFKTPSGPVAFSQKWPLGRRIVRNLDMKMDSETSVPGQPNPIKQNITMGQKYGLTVAKEEAGGGREVDLEFLSMSMKLNQNGTTLIDYDSEKKAADGTNTPVAGVAAIQKMFSNVIGAKLQYHLDSSNEVTSIEGMDQLMSRLATGGSPEASAGLKNMFNEGYLKQMIDSSRFLPSKPVQPGDTWPVQMDLAMGDLGAMVMNYNFTFQNWEKHGKRTCARLEFEGTFKSKPDPNPRPAGIAMTIQDGNSSGVSWFDPELGIAIDSTLNQDLNIAMTVPVPVRGKTVNQTMKTLMHQAINVKLESVK